MYELFSELQAKKHLENKTLLQIKNFITSEVTWWRVEGRNKTWKKKRKS
jgi:hypothetical protein